MLLFSTTLLSFAAFTWSRSLPHSSKNKRSLGQELQAALAVSAGDGGMNPWPWDTKCPPHVIKGGCPYVGGPLLLHKMSHGEREKSTTGNAPCTTQSSARVRCQNINEADVSSLQFPPLLTASLRDESRVCVAWSQGYSDTVTLFKGWVSDLTWLSIAGAIQKGRLVSLAISFKNQLTDTTKDAEVDIDSIEYGSMVYPWNVNIYDDYITLLQGNLTINDIGLTVYRSQGNLLLSEIGNKFSYGEGILGTLGSWRMVNNKLFVRSLDGGAFIPTRLSGTCRLVMAKGEDMNSRIVSL